MDEELHEEGRAGPAAGIGFDISTDPDLLDMARIHRWLSTDAYWALGRPRDTLERAVAGSLNFAAYSTGCASQDGSTQIGYARVITDRATFAWLCDVYVDRAARGRGVGSALVAAVHEHLAPYGLRRIALVTADAHEMYARHGFTRLADPGMWMAWEA